jgi:ABC-2 type transport system permease protein
MRFVALVWKTLVENLRDWKILIMTLTFAPFFVVLMHFYFSEGTTTYRLIVVDRDEGTLGSALIHQLQQFDAADGHTVLRVEIASDIESARRRVREERADVVLEIPPDFSRVLGAYQSGERPPPAVVRTHGDPGNVKYFAAAAFADYLAYEYAQAFAGVRSPVALQPTTVGSIESPNDFALYVPALLALAVIMLMFTAAASLIKEKDRGTLLRLRLSNMTIGEWIAAVSVVQVVIGLATAGLALLTAVVLGYRTAGSLAAATVICTLSCLAMIGISVVVAAWLRTIFDLMTIGCFPFFLLMFFSGGMLPIPDLQLFVVSGRAINANDILPTTHTVSALGRVLNHGAGLNEVAFELGAIAVLTVAFYALGTWLFTRRHMRAA